MELLRVRGTHTECGRQIGEKYRDIIRTAISEIRDYPLAGHTWESMLDLAREYWDATLEAYPVLIDEITGTALGAGLDPLELFTYMIEEMWVEPEISAKACSDVVVTAPLTDGRIIVGHNNDLSPAMGGRTFPVEWNFDDGTSILTVGPLGFYVSIGINSYGVALTGNEVSPTDNKIGIPRAVISRAILTAATIDEALKIATDERRASSYNNVIATADRVVNMEGSARDYELTETVDGFLCHTNHYVCERMLRVEGKYNYVSSIKRLETATEILKGSKGRILTAEDIMKILADHNNGGEADDNSICRHGKESETVFGIVIDFGERKVFLTMGKPCQTEFAEAWNF